MKPLFCFLLISALVIGCKSSTEVQPQSQPTVLDFSPKESMIGEIITIYGKDLPTDTAQLHIFLDSVGVELLTLTTDSIQVRIPDDAISGKFKLKFNSTLLTTDSFTVKDGIYFYPKQVRVGDSVTVYSKPFPSADAIRLAEKTYMGYSAERTVNARRLGKASLRFGVPQGEPKRPLKVTTAKGTSTSRDSLELIPDTQHVKSIQLTIKNLKVTLDREKYTEPFDSLLSKTSTVDTIDIDLSFSSWIDTCSGNPGEISFCLYRSSDIGYENISGYLILDSASSTITKLMFYRNDEYRPYSIHETHRHSYRITLTNLPCTINGATVTANVSGLQCSKILSPIYKTEYLREIGLSRIGYHWNEVASSSEVIPQTELKVTIVR